MEKIQRISSYAIVVEEGKILLCRLSPHVPGAGSWTLPGGGINYGEHPDKAVVREVFEETGLNVAIERLLKVDSDLFENSVRHFHAVRLIYCAKVLGGTLRAELDESTDKCDWFTRSEAESMPLVPLARKAVKLAFEEC